jgi:hypothetical protein
MNDQVHLDGNGYPTYVDQHGTIWKMWGDEWTAYKGGRVSLDTKLFGTGRVTMPTEYDIEKAFREYNPAR